MRHTESWRSYSRACSGVRLSIDHMHEERADQDDKKLTLLTPLLPTRADTELRSPAGEPRYGSFLRLTAGVASSVFLTTFWHVEQTMTQLLSRDETRQSR